MHSYRVAEWVLAKASSEHRASEIIGDLLEQQKNFVEVWFSVLRVILTMHWRWLIAVPAAMFAVALALKPYAEIVISKELSSSLANAHRPQHFGVQPMSPILTVGQYLVIPAMCLWTVAALALFRYGLAALTTRLSLLLALMFTVASCSLELPHATVFVPSALALSLGALLFSSRIRRAFGCILLSSTAFAGCFMTFAAAAGLFTPIVTKHQDHAGILPALFACASLVAYAACVTAEAWVLSRSQRWLLLTE
jgi:hypothetical protein